MFSIDSSSTGSPFSNQSTDPSSPETNIQAPPTSTSTSTSLTDSYTQALQAQAAAQKNGFASLFGMTKVGAAAGTGTGAGIGQIGQQGITVKTEPGVGIRPSYPPSSYNPPNIPRPISNHDHKPSFHSSSVPSSRATSVGLAESVNGNGNGNGNGSVAPSGIAAGAGIGISGLIPQLQSRSDPPKRLIEIDMLPLGNAPVQEIKASSSRNVLLLQGDPQIINKQRVETAIRVILDLLRAIPPTPTTPALPPALFNILPPDHTLTNLALERINCFRGLRLQIGTTTKAIAKKQLQAGKTPDTELVYLETAVYMSGENGRRVYACKRCRLREQRRRASKDASRKKPPSSGSDTSSSKHPHHGGGRAGIPPSPDYITGSNSDQYDPHRTDQLVEEPGFDPNRPDWRHEIVLFNSAPEVPIKDGSCMWLPFRVVCYGKCHGEKIGFRIKFTLRTLDGAIISTSTTDPIRITDDHKTDKTAKPKETANSSTHAQPAMPRPRKGRASAASSRRQSPAPSEGESVQSISEAGAVMQKQTPNVRAKPYDRPPSHSPAVGTGSLPFDYTLPGTLPNVPPAPRYQRQHSSGSLHSLTAINQLSGQDDGGLNTSFPRTIPNEFINIDPLPVAGTVSPGALRRPNFGMTPLDPYNAFPISAPHSATSSNVASPINGLRPLSDDMLMASNPLFAAQQQTNPLSGAFASLNAISAQQQQQAASQQQQNLMLSDYLADQDIANTLNSAMDGLFDVSSHASLASSLNDDTSGFSGYRDSQSGLFSDSGVVPDTGMESFLDFSGGEDQGLSQPAFTTDLSPPGGSEFPSLFDLDLGNSPVQPIFSSDLGMAGYANTQAIGSGYGGGAVGGVSPTSAGLERDAQLEQMLAAFTNNQSNSPNVQIPTASASIPIPPQPVVSHVIPSEGPMAGGIQVAVAGQRFAPGMTIVFGSRVAKTMVISDSFCTCELPPAIEAGAVEVVVQGAMKMQGQKIEVFRYLGMDREMMRLALEVRDQYQGSSSDAAYRLAQRIAQGSVSGNSSDRSSASPMASGPSPTFLSKSTVAEAKIGPETKEDDLQLTVTNFLASIDEHAPGSLRRSGCINTPNKAQQTLLHIATVMGFHRLVRRLILMGADVDLQDVNGYTALAFASLSGQVACARVLIEAGAAYDRPTAFGEMPLDLAKLGDRADVEALLLSAVWSTSPEPPAKVSTPPPPVSASASTIPKSNRLPSEIDDDNPSSGSEIEDDITRVQPIKRRMSKKARGKMKAPSPPSALRPLSRRASFASLGESSGSTQIVSPAQSSADDPPPYEPATVDPAHPHRSAAATGGSWMSRTLSNISSASTSAASASIPSVKLPESIWSRFPLPLPSFLDNSTKRSTDSSAQNDTHTQGYGWIALPAPSWETLQKMTSPEEVKLFTQAMAAQALNAIVQSTAGLEAFGGTPAGVIRTEARVEAVSAGPFGGRDRKGRRKSRGNNGEEGGSASPDKSGSRRSSRRGSSNVEVMVDREGTGADGRVVKQVKQDKMLYLFWLPILLFVGFWLVVTALPIATGFGLIYARQITRAIKQKI